MKVQIASDLHLERFGNMFSDRRVPEYAPGAQLLVLAGDIGSGDQALAEFAHWPVPVVIVGGNHEAYGSTLERATGSCRIRAQALGMHYLECDVAYISGVRVLGCTLWTDYQLYGNPIVARKFAKAMMADHKLIMRYDGSGFEPEDAALIHARHRQWLQSELAKPFEGKTIVVTHHGPHPLCEAKRFKNSPYNPAFFSDMRRLMDGVDLWVHGHLHDGVDVREGNCRVVCNPRGYPLNLGTAASWRDLRFENTSFKPKLTVEV